jgi:hypothetical protein
VTTRPAPCSSWTWTDSSRSTTPRAMRPETPCCGWWRSAGRMRARPGLHWPPVGRRIRAAAVQLHHGASGANGAACTGQHRHAGRHPGRSTCPAPASGSPYPYDGTDIDALLRHADQAMYQAKATIATACSFSAEMNRRAGTRCHGAGPAPRLGVAS